MAGTPHRAGTYPVVVGLGGNTLLGKEGAWTFEHQIEAIAETAGRIASGIDAGYDIVLTHGNGPQVGNLLLEQDAVSETPRRSLDVLVAETQAQVGYLLQQKLDNELRRAPDFLTIVTQVVVDRDDPAFDRATKPIGPFYTEDEAEGKPFETRKVGEGTRPYRRVVPSPDPREIVESEEIAQLVEGGNLVICGGGGGVPVVRAAGLSGVEAVIDKDKTSAVLAETLGAHTFVILTDVEHAYLEYDSPDPEPIGAVSTDALRSHLEAGQFAEGSMQPKVEACLQFVESGGERAVITAPAQFEAALECEAGTVVRRASP